MRKITVMVLLGVIIATLTGCRESPESVVNSANKCIATGNSEKVGKYAHGEMKVWLIFAAESVKTDAKMAKRFASETVLKSTINGDTAKVETTAATLALKKIGGNWQIIGYEDKR